MRASTPTPATTTSSSRRLLPGRDGQPTTTRIATATTDGRDWVYADLDGIGNGYSPDQAGALTVNSSGDTTAPATPTGPARRRRPRRPAIELAWDAVAGDPTLYGYEVLRGDAPAGRTRRSRATGDDYTDTDVDQGETYYYVVRVGRHVVQPLAPSRRGRGDGRARTVTLDFNVTVPASTDATGRSVAHRGLPRPPRRRPARSGTRARWR